MHVAPGETPVQNQMLAPGSVSAGGKGGHVTAAHGPPPVTTQSPVWPQTAVYAGPLVMHVAEHDDPAMVPLQSQAFAYC